MKNRQSKYSFSLAHLEVRAKPYVYFHKTAYITSHAVCLKLVSSNHRPARWMWPATAFSAASGTIQKKSSNFRFIEKRVRLWGYICFNELLALDRVFTQERWKKHFCVPLLFLFYLFYDHIRRYGPPLTLRWGTWLYNFTRFYGAPTFVVLASTSGAVNSISPNKSVYLSAKRDLFKLALEPNWLSIPTIENCNYCRTSITSVNKNVGYTILTVLETVKNFWKLVSKDRFCTKNGLDVGKHIDVLEHVHFLRWSKSNLQ